MCAVFREMHGEVAPETDGRQYLSRRRDGVRGLGILFLVRRLPCQFSGRDAEAAWRRGVGDEVVLHHHPSAKDEQPRRGDPPARDHLTARDIGRAARHCNRVGIWILCRHRHRVAE